MAIIRRVSKPKRIDKEERLGPKGPGMGLSALGIDQYQLRRSTEFQATTDCRLPIRTFQYGGAPEPLSMIVSPVGDCSSRLRWLSPYLR